MKKKIYFSLIFCAILGISLVLIEGLGKSDDKTLIYFLFNKISFRWTGKHKT